MDSGDVRSSFWTLLLSATTLDAAVAVARAEAAGNPAREAELIAAWRSHAALAADAENRMDARLCGLEALQAFGRALGEARSVEDLMRAAADALCERLEIDAVAFAGASAEGFRTEVHVARPLRPEDVARVAAAAEKGFTPAPAGAPTVRTMRRFDPFQGPRRTLLDEEILVVPIARRGIDVLRLAVVPTAAVSERMIGLVFGASNHLALHLDRVLAVAEAESGRFRAILDSMPHAVVLLDGSFRVIQANASAEQLLSGWPEAAEALRSVGDLDLLSLAYDVLAGRSNAAGGEAQLPDGTRFEVSIAPWQDRPSRVDGLVVVMLDVTAAHRLREQIAGSEKLSTLGRLIAGVAHDINNPLTSVIGYAQLLRTIPPGPAADKRLDTIRKEAERCRRIVQNLLKFARPGTSERRPFSLNEVAEGVAQLLAYPVRCAGCRIVVESAPDLPAVLGDEHAIEQALVNLVTNAQQALEGAGIAGTIHVRTRCDDVGRPVLEVEDDGPGIPEEARARVFDPFFTTKEAGRGTGLGLWLVANAAADHGGRVDALEGALGGALVRITLAAGTPCPVVEDAGADAIDDAPRVSARILVLDAEAALAALICEALAGEGHAAVACSEASAALTTLSADPFDLVVSDATLPGLPGDRLAAELDRIRPELGRRLLLTTGDWVSREPETLARRVGAGLLRKPFEIEELRRVVRRQLTRKAEA